MSTKGGITNYANVIGSLKALNKDVDKAITRTVADCKQRAPAQVTKAVTAVYGIKASEVTEAGKYAKRGAKPVGRIKVKGVTLDNLQFVYKGRLLTPRHFSMTPMVPPGKGEKVKIKAAIFKGKRKVIHKSAFLQRVGKKDDEKEDPKYIPFKRVGKKSSPIEAIRTVSIPQMIDNEKVNADINERMEELIIKRLNHNTNRVASKK